MFLSGIAKVIKIIPLSLMLGFLSDISSALQIEPGPVTESEAVNGGDDSCVEDLVVDKNKLYFRVRSATAGLELFSID
ncbi:MAG: hypothetical protein CBE15_02440 [Euryarchaeota archaeon TMED255]|nr:MAG: hypothetical protein CBE15_02440 [Euryarchaeota archaeon TMED255]|tara:strand:+ start:1311 stop:1544 length:234 start_codon:yes stop_codon:yes gene_type:complete